MGFSLFTTARSHQGWYPARLFAPYVVFRLSRIVGKQAGPNRRGLIFCNNFNRIRFLVRADRPR